VWCRDLWGGVDKSKFRLSASERSNRYMMILLKIRPSIKIVVAIPSYVIKMAVENKPSGEFKKLLRLYSSSSYNEHRRASILKG
jgi:hypothetical protein